jgi:hypothetical protein
MATLTLKNVPEELGERLKLEANSTTSGSTEPSGPAGFDRRRHPDRAAPSFWRRLTSS